MRVSVIVPAFNEEKLLPRCLEHLHGAVAAFTERHWGVEVIVCDNNSTDRTAEIARAEGACVVFEPVNQIARARNRGAAAATGEWLVFIDADAIPERRLFESMARAIEGGGVAGGGALVALEGVGGVARAATHLWNALSVVCRWAAGSCVFCDTGLFRELGGFSEELFASEEIEFSQRLKRAGKQRGRKVVILLGPPLLSSGRKLQFCTMREYLRLLWQLIQTRGQVLRKRERLGIWYDGRR